VAFAVLLALATALLAFLVTFLATLLAALPTFLTALLACLASGDLALFLGLELGEAFMGRIFHQLATLGQIPRSPPALRDRFDPSWVRGQAGRFTFGCSL